MKNVWLFQFFWYKLFNQSLPMLQLLDIFFLICAWMGILPHVNAFSVHSHVDTEVVS